MKKKTYKTPHTELIYLITDTHLLNASLDKVGGGGPLVPEAKPITLPMVEDYEEEETAGLPHFSVWGE